MASITKITTKSGEIRYRVRYRTPARKQEERWFRKKTDADLFKATTEADMARGVWIDPRRSTITFGQWSITWLAGRSHLKPKTVEGYESLLGVHILPVFGARTLGSIGAESVAVWVADLKATGLSASRVGQAFSVLNSVFSFAVDCGRLVRNPAAARSIRQALPRTPIREMRFLTSEEVIALTTAVGDQYAALILTLAVGGLRFGEAVALRKGRVDVLGRRLHVAESATEVHGKLVFGTTKSGRDRWVEVPRFVAHEIGVRMKEPADDPNSLVFATPDGKPLRNSNFRTRVWPKALVDAGIDTDTRIHDLRHTAASLMIQDGAPLFLIQRQLGHASVSTTQRYSHLYPSQGTELAERINARFEILSGAHVGSSEVSVIPMAR